MLLLATFTTADSVVTDPAGFTTTSCPSNSDTLVSVPFTRPQAFIARRACHAGARDVVAAVYDRRGSVVSFAGGTVTVFGSPGEFGAFFLRLDWRDCSPSARQTLVEGV